MKPETDQPLTWGHVLLGLAALASLFGTAAPASAQSTANHPQLLQHIQSRGHRALQKINLANASGEQATLLDQRWTYEWNGAQWGQAAQTVYVYEQTDRTEEWQFVWNGSVMMNQSRTTYQFASGNQLVELHEGYDLATSSFYEMDRYTYGYLYDLYTGEPVFLHTMTHEMKIGAEWRPIERTTYTQPTETELVGIVDEWAGEEWTPRERFSMIETPQSVVQTYETRTGTEWSYTERATFPGFTIERLRETTDAFMEAFLDYAGLNVAAHLYPNYITEKWNGLDWVPSERKVSIVMDPDVGSGLLFRGALYESWDDGQWIPEQRQVTTQRMSDEKVVRATLDVPTGDTWLTTLVETFEYDNNLDLSWATQQVDFGEGMENSLRFQFLWETPSVGIEDDEVPDAYALDAAYPNPFNPSTTIQYRLASAGSLSIRAYDALGRHVATLFEGSQVAGTHEAAFDAQGLSSGIYLIRLEAAGFSQTRSVTLLK